MLGDGWDGTQGRQRVEEQKADPTSGMTNTRNKQDRTVTHLGMTKDRVRKRDNIALAVQVYLVPAERGRGF
jgi:hypothetical protein